MILASRALKIVAYSTPITPAPITTMERGTFLICSRPSLSMMVSSSNGMFAGRWGTVPVAITMDVGPVFCRLAR